MCHTDKWGTKMNMRQRNRTATSGKHETLVSGALQTADNSCRNSRAARLVGIHIIIRTITMGTEKDNKEGHGWGGRRAGAGRPPTGGQLFTFRTDADMAAHINNQPNKTEYIRGCIKADMAYDTTRAETAGRGKHTTVSAGKDMAEGIRTSIGDVYPATILGRMHIPFFDIGIVAGFPIPLDNDERSQDIDLLRMLCPHPEASYLIRVCGDSMRDAGIASGDIVIVDKSNRSPSAKDVAVCEYNGEYTLKHFVMEDGRGWLVPANPSYPRIEVKENDTFSVWGTVTYIIHKPKE